MSYGGPREDKTKCKIVNNLTAVGTLRNMNGEITYQRSDFSGLEDHANPRPLAKETMGRHHERVCDVGEKCPNQRRHLLGRSVGGWVGWFFLWI